MTSYGAIHLSISLLSKDFDQSRANKQARERARIYLRGVINKFREFISHDPDSEPSKFLNGFIDYIQLVIDYSIQNEQLYE